MSNIATLGLEFTSGNASSQIKTLINRFDALEKKCGSTQKALDKMFGNFAGKISNASRVLGKLNSGLVNTSKFSGNAGGALAQIQKIIDGIGKRKINPISASAAKNAAELAAAMQNLEKSMTGIPLTRLNLTPVTSSANQFGNAIGEIEGKADAAAIALHSLQGAFSIDYLKNAINHSIRFRTELAYIKSIAAELNAEQIGAGLMNFSSMLGDPAENAEALYYAYSSGIRGTEEDFIRFTEIASKAAQVNRASLVPMIDAMTAAMNAYNMEVSQVGEVADNFFAIVKYGKASGEQLANSFGQVSPTAKTLGVTLDELGAAIASLTKIQPTRVAITGLNNMLSKIMKPTKESRLALERLGVDMSYSAVQSKGFVTVLREVHDALGGNMEALKNIFPDIRGQRAAMHLLGAGWEDFNQQLENFANKTGEMEEAFNTLTSDPSVQLSMIPVTLNKITTEAGAMATHFLTLGGALNPVIEKFNSMGYGEEKISKLGEAARKLFGYITLLVGVYGSYKAVILATNTLQAMQIRNNEILGRQQQQLATAAMAAQAAQNASSSVSSFVAQTRAAKQNTEAVLQRIKAFREQLEVSKRAAIAANNEARLQEINTKLLRLKNIEQSKNNALAAANKALNAASNLQGAIPPTKADFAANFLTGATKSGSGAGDIARDVQYQKDMALAQALHNAELQRGAAANGEYTMATKLAKAATSDYKNYLRLASMEQKVNTMAQKAAEHQAKATNATTKLSIMYHKMAATGLKVQARAWVSVTAGIRAAGVALKSFLASAWPLLVISLAIEGLIMLWDKLDITGAGALEKQRERLAEIDERYSEINRKHDEEIQKTREQGAAAEDAAIRLANIASLGKLNNLEIQAAQPLIAKVNDYLGYQAAAYDEINGKITLQNNLLEGVRNKQTALLHEQYNETRSLLEQELKLLKDVQKAAEEEITDNNFYHSDNEIIALEESMLAVRKMQDSIDKLNLQELQGISNIIKQEGGAAEDAAIQLAKMADSGKLGDLEKQHAQSLIARVNSYLGDEAVEYDEVNGKIKIQGELLDEIRRKQQKILNMQYEEKYAELTKKRDEALAKFNAAQAEEERDRELMKNRPVGHGARQTINTEKAKVEYERAEKNLRELSAQQANLTGVIDEETYAQREKSIQKAIELEHKLQEAAEDFVFSGFNDVEKIAWINQDIAELNQQIGEYQRNLASGITSSDDISWEEKIADAQLQTFQKRVEIFKLAEQMQQNLANAEQNANTATLNLIKSMDKFKSSAVSTVNAYSTEALKLQSRRFDALPEFTPQTRQQEQLASVQRRLAAAALAASGPIEQLRQRIAALGTASQIYIEQGTNRPATLGEIQQQRVEAQQQFGNQGTQPAPVNSETSKYYSQMSKTGTQLEQWLATISNSMNQATNTLQQIAKKSGINISSVRI